MLLYSTRIICPKNRSLIEDPEAMLQQEGSAKTMEVGTENADRSNREGSIKCKGGKGNILPVLM